MKPGVLRSCENFMSALGHKRTFRTAIALGQKADSCIAAKIREGLARDQFRVLAC